MKNEKVERSFIPGTNFLIFHSSFFIFNFEMEKKAGCLTFVLLAIIIIKQPADSKVFF